MKRLLVALFATFAVCGGTNTAALTTTTDPVIMAAGDIACPSSTATATACRQGATSNIIYNALPTVVLDLGDNQYDAGSLSAYKAFYGPTWGRFFARTKPSPGNHEYMTSGAAGYFGYFGVTPYYSFNVGAWHLISLDSEIAHGSTSAQIAWLKKDLAAHPAACTLAYWHRPRFSSGRHGNESDLGTFWAVLYAYHVDVVLNGHDHDYERFARQTPSGTASSGGIREFVVGTGGKSHYGFATIQANSQVRNSSTFGVLQLTLHATSYAWRFLPEAGKTFTDYGSTSCT